MSRKSAGRSRKPRARSKKQVNTLHSIKRTVVFSLPKIAADTGNYTSLDLSVFPGLSDITSLFQYYRIKNVVKKFYLVSAPNNNATFPTLYIAKQQINQSGIPASRDEVLQFQGVQTHQFGPSNLMKTVTTVPCVTLDANNAVGGGMIKYSPWLSTNNINIRHYTFVEWYTRYNSTTDSTHTLDVELTINIECKGTK